jgi:ubiquinone biosynthesis protein COQ9
MDDTEFDTALIASALKLAGEEGWRSVTPAAAAKAAGLSLPEARVRFPNKATILLRFGRMADQAALEEVLDEEPVRGRLFALLMRRFDALQAHRAGVVSVMRALPMDPPMAVMLSCATRRSMRWMLQAAGVKTTGIGGELRVRGLVAVWLWAMRAWERDETEDLTSTMAALDAALARAEQAAGWLAGRPAIKVEVQTQADEPIDDEPEAADA